MKRDRFPTEWHAQQAYESAGRALQLLVQARNELANACAPKTLDRVRLAVSSCKGAVRNAHARVVREYYDARRIEDQREREYLVIDTSEPTDNAIDRPAPSNE
jgi:hypothetical protein